MGRIAPQNIKLEFLRIGFKRFVFTMARCDFYIILQVTGKRK